MIQENREMGDQNRQPKNTRIQKIVAIVLTAAFVPLIFGFGIYGIASNPAGIVQSLRFSQARKFLSDPEDTGFFSMISARIASLQNRLGENIPFSDQLGIINASFQFGLGKQMVVQGSEQMLQLDNGQLYCMTRRESLAEGAQDVVELYEHLKGRVPFLFSYVQPGFYNGSLAMPEGYEVLDNGDALADEVLSIIRSAGIDALDSRTFFEDSGFTNDELQLKTDKHWTARAALLASQIYAKEINRLTGANLDVQRLSLDRFDEEVYEDLFLGSYGEQVGEVNAPREDITVFVPKYDTNLSRYSRNSMGDEQQETGPFGESVLRRQYLAENEDGPNVKAYTAYGLTEVIDELTNHGDCEDLTILMLKDSYSAPISSFLSLTAKNVISVDYRYEKRGIDEIMEKYNPDIVIVSFSRMMFEEHNYDFGLDA